MQNIKITLQLKKVQISNFNINIFKEKNVDAIQIFISKVSNFQEEIHYKMRNSLKILEHLDIQLEKESELVMFLAKFPELYKICSQENSRRKNMLLMVFNNIENLRKIMILEKETQLTFFKENLLNGIEYYPKNLFPDLISDDESLETSINNLWQMYHKKIQSLPKDEILLENKEFSNDENFNHKSLQNYMEQM